MLGLPESAFAAGVTTLTTQDAKHAAYRRYQVPAAANLLDFDGDALVNGLTDGLIALRYMRMFRTPETTPETTCSA